MGVFNPALLREEAEEERIEKEKALALFPQPVKQPTPLEREKLDPVTFAVIDSRLRGIALQMMETIHCASRSIHLNSSKDFTCTVMTYDGFLLTMAKSLPIHILTMDSALWAVINEYKDDIHPGDVFANNSPYYGNVHPADLCLFAPIFFEGGFIAWAAAKCHLLDLGAHIPSSVIPFAKDVYEDVMHFPPWRMAKDHNEIQEQVRLVKANFRYPEQWHGDFLAQMGSLWVAEKEVIKLCEKYGPSVVKQFQDEYLDYGDARMTNEIKKLPKGSWYSEVLTQKFEGIAPDGCLLKLKMSIDPDNAKIIFDLSDMPDQLPWGFNLSYAASRTACVQASMTALDSTLPRNHGVYKHFDVYQRIGSLAGIPRWPASTSISTVGIADELSNQVLNLWEEAVPGRGHGGNGMLTAAFAGVSGTDFRRNNKPFGHLFCIAAGGGGASKGYDGWPNIYDSAIMGDMFTEQIEIHELKCPNIVWETGIQTDSAGAGRWRGGPAIYMVVQPRHYTMTGVAYGTGHTDAPQGVRGGKPGCLGDHWTRKHTNAHHWSDKADMTQQLKNACLFLVREDEDWVVLTNGGGGYGDPLERDPEAVAIDATDYIISIEAARNVYGVVLNTDPENYEVDYPATEKLRAQLRRKEGVK